MKYFHFKNVGLILFLLLIIYNASAQVGIGTTSPDASSMLDLSSSTKGLLAPRMTTAEKNAISSPAEGLLVYDTDLGKFNYFNSSSWITLEANTGRDNFILVKTLSDLPTPVANVITLQSGKLYEINGSISLGSNSIDLNGCVLVGGDPNNDILTYTGSTGLFSGTQGGLVQFLNLQGAAGSTKLLNLNDATKTKNLIIRDSFVSNFGSIGTITGYSFVFTRTLNYYNNITGITFSGNDHLYLYDMIWNEGNTGTAVSFNGTFDLISITGGHFDIGSGETGIDVTASITINSDAIIRGASITGAGTRTDGTFAKEWEIDASGINTEKDDVATGSIYINSAAVTAISSANTPVKVSGTTSSANLFRVDTNSQNNRLRYTGTKTRNFTLLATFSMLGANNKLMAFHIYKNGVNISSIYVENKLLNAGDVGAASIMGTVSLATNDYVELWVENKSGSQDVTINAMNFIIY